MSSRLYKTFFLVFITLLLTSFVFAKGAKQSICHSKLEKCVSHLSKIAKVHLVQTEKFEGNAYLPKGLKLDQKSADYYLALILNKNGYARIFEEPGVFSIISAKDLRYNVLPIRNGNKESVPDTYDYYMVNYRLKNPALSSTLTKSMRPFMARYGRILANRIVGNLTIQDTGRNINRLLRIVKSVDENATSGQIKEQKEKNKNWEMARLRAESCKNPK